jgi:hypothetical protein
MPNAKLLYRYAIIFIKLKPAGLPIFGIRHLAFGIMY